MNFQFLFDWLINGAINFANTIIDTIALILPNDPFDAYIGGTQAIPIVNIVNYFVPIPAMISITLAWAQALLFFYGEAILARWVKILGD